MITIATCPACEGDGELATTGEALLEAALKRSTTIRGYYLAARRVLQFVHLYRAEGCSKPGAEWRTDHRVVSCIARIRELRGQIAALRDAPRVPLGHRAWCISCSGTGLADNACELDRQYFDHERATPRGESHWGAR